MRPLSCNQVLLPSQFVSALVALAMKQDDASFPKSMLTYLLQAKAVSDSFHAEGLAKTLFERGYWVRDISTRSLP